MDEEQNQGQKDPATAPADTGSAATDAADKRKRLNLWKYRISRAKRIRDDWETEYKVKELENCYLGKQTTEGTKAFNHFLSTLKAELPELFFTNPTFLVRPKPGQSGPAEDRKVKRGEGILQSIATHEDNLEISGEFATLQAFFRMGVVKCVYDPTLEPNPQAGKPIYQHGADNAPIMDPKTMQPQPLVDPQTQQPLTEPDFVLSDEMYRWEWVDAKKILLPDAGPDDRKWPWVGEEIVIPLEEAKQDQRFPEDLRRQLRSNVSSDPEKDASKKSDQPETEEMIKYVECYDIKNKRWYVYVDGQDFEDDFLLDDDVPDGIKDHPYCFLTLNPIMGPKPSPWPLPEVASWKPIQEEYNIRRNQTTEGCKRSARKIGYDEGTFADPDEALKALQSSKDMEAVKLNSVKNPWVVIQDPGQPPDLWKDIGALQQDWRLITGQTGANLGDPNSRTATEAAFAQRASNARSVDKRKLVTRWMRQAGRKMFQLVQATMTVDKWVKIRGLSADEVKLYAQQVYGLNPIMLEMLPNIKELLIDRLGKEDWVCATREEITFEADVDVVPGSVRPRNLDLERQEWLELIKIIGAFPQLLLSRELLMETATKYETISPKMVDELIALGPRMMMAAQATAGRQGDNQKGGGSGPTPEANTLTAMAGAIQ